MSKPPALDLSKYLISFKVPVYLIFIKAKRVMLLVGIRVL